MNISVTEKYNLQNKPCDLARTQTVNCCTRISTSNYPFHHTIDRIMIIVNERNGEALRKASLTCLQIGDDRAAGEGPFGGIEGH